MKNSYQNYLLEFIIWNFFLKRKRILIETINNTMLENSSSKGYKMDI
jgi:hypothetical protein